MAVESRPQRWADVADSEGCEEYFAIPAFVGDAAREASPGRAMWSNPRSSLCHDTSSVSRHVIVDPVFGTSAGLRVGAPEFIPTQTMHCPLVGLCEIDSVQASVEQQCVVEPQARRQKRNKAARYLPVQRQSPQEVGVMPEASEEVWQQRMLQRQKVLDTLRARVLRLTQQQQGSGTPPYCDMENTQHCNVDDSPPQLVRTPSAWSGASSEVQKEWVLSASGPDPEDRTISRRQWRKAVDAWFKACLMVAECHGSVVSTEECISTNCDAESDCSD